jgi:catalase
LAGIARLRTALSRAGTASYIVAPVGGTLGRGARAVPVDRTLLTARSIEFDAVVVAAGTVSSRDIKLVLLLQEALRHCKPLAAWGDGAAVLEDAAIALDEHGVVVAAKSDKALADAVIQALGLHRAWDRAPAAMGSSLAPAEA